MLCNGDLGFMYMVTVVTQKPFFNHRTLQMLLFCYNLIKTDFLQLVTWSDQSVYIKKIAYSFPIAFGPSSGLGFVVCLF